jgi:phage terminase small subunit
LSTDLNRSTAPEKKGSRHNPQHDGHSIRESVPSFSPTTAKEQWRKVKLLLTTNY